MTYKNKPLETWFYGSRTNFFHEKTRAAAQEAFDSCGTNAVPFLLSKLNTAQGNGSLYFSLHRSLPDWVQSKLPYPISGDDIKAIALDHIRKMSFRSGEQVQALANCVPGLRNPRLRMMGLYVMGMKHQTHPAFLALCRNLLNDPHPGIQLEAAISLADSANASDGAEPRLFPILLAALESKEKRNADLDVLIYQYLQQPPGGSGTPNPFAGSPRSPLLHFPPPDQTLKRRIETALERLKPHLTQAEKDSLGKAKQFADEQAQESRAHEH